VIPCSVVDTNGGTYHNATRPSQPRRPRLESSMPWSKPCNAQNAPTTQQNCSIQNSEEIKQKENMIIIITW